MNLSKISGLNVYIFFAPRQRALIRGRCIMIRFSEVGLMKNVLQLLADFV